MHKLTSILTENFLNSIDIYIEHSRHNICYEGYISTSMSCYKRIIHYYKIQNSDDELPQSLLLSTPCVFRVYSDNNITYNIELNNAELVMGTEDLEYIFKEEFRIFTINSILKTEING